MQSRYDYLSNSSHDLYFLVRQCAEFINAGNEEQEEQTLAAAFKLFKPPGKDHLGDKEVKTMLDYLGFPASNADVSKVMAAVDKDGDRKMTMNEFQSYVGKMGGSFKLFEVRRMQMAAAGSEGSGKIDPTQLRMSLKEAGIKDD